MYKVLGKATKIYDYYNFFETQNDKKMSSLTSKLSILFMAGLTSMSILAQQVSGTLVDSVTNNPIANAVVTLHGGSAQVLTDINGNYNIDISGSGLLLVGGAKGYYYQSITVNSPVTGALIALDPVPVGNNNAYEVRPPQECGSCHPKQHTDWLGSPMAKAGFNTWVNDIYNGDGTAGGQGGFVYTRDSVFATSNPNSECAACHQPKKWIENPFSALDSNVSSPSESVQHGISCDVCHKVADVDESKINFPGIFPGAVVYNRPNPGTQVQYGILGDVDFSIPSLMQASYQPQIRAELCATCHQDAADPNEDHSYSGVISEPTYLEWLASDYANPNSPNFADCVDCHMGASPDNQVCSIISTPDRPVASVRNHRIEGSTPAFLENAVELNMQVNANDSEISVQITVNNNLTGHHVPTGVTVRNMILLVEAWEEGNDPLINPLSHSGSQVIHDLAGIGDPANGYYAGMAGKFYAKVAQDSNGNSPTFFTEATSVQFDNRIPANQSDVTHYSFQLPNYQAEINVRARLIYRRAFRALVDAKNWTEDGHGNPLADVSAPHFGHLMESAEQSLAAGNTVIPFLNEKGLILLLLLLFAIGYIRLKPS